MQQTHIGSHQKERGLRVVPYKIFIELKHFNDKANVLLYSVIVCRSDLLINRAKSLTYLRMLDAGTPAQRNPGPPRAQIP